jgi:hypothetical protein
MYRKLTLLLLLVALTATQVALQSMEPNRLTLWDAQSRNVELPGGGNHRSQPQLVQETWASWYPVQNCLM